MNTRLYNRKPLKFIKNIPIFTSSNEYTKNYERLDRDQLRKIQETGENPWIKESLWQELENATFKMAIKYCQKGKVLDVGVGLGRLLNLFPDSFEKYGIDISLDFLEVAQKKDIEICYGMIEEIPYKNHSFDLVICTDVLEHVLDLNKAVEKILSVLKEDGTLIIRTPYKEDLSKYFIPNYPYKYAHLRNFDEYSLKLLFEKIFNCHVLKYKTVGSAISGHKYYLSDKTRTKLMQYTQYFSIINRNLCQKMISWINKTKPIIIKGLEINMAISKK